MTRLPLRSVAVIGAGCVFAGWLLASMVSPPLARMQAPTVREARVVVPDAAFTERLRLRLHEAPEPPVSRRNPFTFGRSVRQGGDTAPLDPVAMPDVAPAEPLSEPPRESPAIPFTLSGIGVTGELRTAILSDGVSVYVVRIGDRVRGFEIADITETAVTLLTPTSTRVLIRLP